MNEELSELRIREASRYVESARCTELQKRLREFAQNAHDCLKGGGTRHRTFAVIGASGSGKSTSLKRAFGQIEAFQPYVNKYGETIQPLISLEVPRPSSTKDLVIKVLQEMNLPVKQRQNEHELFAIAKQQLKARGVLFLHLDEAQTLLRAKTRNAVSELQERLKSLLSVPDWPLHTIYSGVPELAALFNGDQQLPNRAEVMRFSALSCPGDEHIMRSVLKEIAENHCGLSLSPELDTDDFLGRLCSATQGSYGTMIEMIREACFTALAVSKKKLEPGAFARIYERYSGCRPADNIFKAKVWRDIDRANALADLAPAMPSSRRGNAN